MNAILKALAARFTNVSIRHILLNYSEGEVGIKHPGLPAGLVLRDQGQADLYAGMSRIILSMEGHALVKSDTVGLAAREIYLNTPGIQSVKLAGKSLSRELFAGKKVAAVRGDLEQVWVIGPATRVDPETGEILNKLPISEVLEAHDLFEEDPDDPTLDPDRQKFAVFDKVMRGGI